SSVRGAATAGARRTRLGPPSPWAVVGWRAGARRLRGAGREARRPWRRTGDTTARPARAPARRTGRATAAKGLDHVRPAITAGQRPRPTSGTRRVRRRGSPAHARSRRLHHVPRRDLG